VEAQNGLGEFIRERRESLGITGRLLATSAQIDPTQLSRIETGRMKTLPEPELLRKLTHALRCSMADLLEAAGYLDSSDRQTVIANPFESFDLRWHVVEAMRTLDTDDEQNEWLLQMMLRQLRSDEMPRVKRSGHNERTAG
jgi:transcriptional regulator with XRE-family HTH domain